METTIQKPATEIRFLKHYITDGVTKAKVSYSRGQIYITPGKPETQDCITIYAKDYSRDLGKIFGTDYKNETDIMTDYFDKGHMRIFPASRFWTFALTQVERRA